MNTNHDIKTERASTAYRSSRQGNPNISAEDMVDPITIAEDNPITAAEDKTIPLL